MSVTNKLTPMIANKLLTAMNRFAQALAETLGTELMGTYERWECDAHIS